MCRKRPLRAERQNLLRPLTGLVAFYRHPTVYAVGCTITPLCGSSKFANAQEPMAES